MLPARLIEAAPGQPDRLASFIGLAAVLLLVSFLYQRFMTGKDEEEKQRDSFLGVTGDWLNLNNKV